MYERAVIACILLLVSFALFGLSATWLYIERKQRDRQLRAYMEAWRAAAARRRREAELNKRRKL